MTSDISLYILDHSTFNINLSSHENGVSIICSLGLRVTENIFFNAY